MIERVEKQRIMESLRRAGLWREADRFRDEVRQRLRAEGSTKQEAVAEAWDEMAVKFLCDGIVKEIRATRDEALAKLREEAQRARTRLRKLVLQARRAKQPEAEQPPAEEPEEPKPLGHGDAYLASIGLLPCPGCKAMRLERLEDGERGPRFVCRDCGREWDAEPW